MPALLPANEMDTMELHDVKRPQRYGVTAWDESVKDRPLFRYFDTAERANALTNGVVRITTLATCRAMEDPQRRDEEEGRLDYNSGSITGSSGETDFDLVAARLGIGVVPGGR